MAFGYWKVVILVIGFHVRMILQVISVLPGVLRVPFTILSHQHLRTLEPKSSGIIFNSIRHRA